jgi:hypothetical protein
MGKLRFLILALVGMTLLWSGRGDTLAAGPGASYTAPLSSGEEVPPRTSPASGQATFQVSADGQSLTYSVTVQNIANVTMGHIHLGAKGANGDIVLPLVPMAPPAGGPKSGVIGQGTATAAQLVGPLQGKPLADLLAQLDAGNAYVNIHTGAGGTAATLQPGDLPAGEIRGQIALTTAPAATGATATRAAGTTAPAAATATRVGTATVPTAATATRVGTATVTAAATATQAVVATVPPTASAPPPATMPRTGGGGGTLASMLPWLALAVLLTLGLALAVRARRRA